MIPRPTATTGYYGVPLLKPPVWTWEVPVYFFVGGAAGASAVIAGAAEWSGRSPALARDARWVAAAGGNVSAVLLTADLGRPERFVNMLRVFKPHSAMSVGSWTLASFSAAGTTAVIMDTLARRLDRPALAAAGRVTTTMTAMLGTVMATYTGVLIGATAVPAWNENVTILPLHFAASGLASAVATLQLLGHDEPVLNDLGLAAAAFETIAGADIERRRTPGSAPLRSGASGWIVRIGGVLSGPVPLVCRTYGRRSRTWRRAASVAALAGSLLTRLGWIAAGRASARDPVLPLQPHGHGAIAGTPPTREALSAHDQHAPRPAD